MVTFQELEISQDGSKLIIEASVIDSKYYTNVYLKDIKIDTQDTYTGLTPSSKVVYEKTFDSNTKHIKLELDKGDLSPSIKDNLFFIYIETTGTPAADTPCGGDNSVVLGTICYMYDIYCNMLKVLQKEYKHRCDVPRYFLNSFLKYKALQLALVTGDNLQAIKYFNAIHEASNFTIEGGCNCHGH